MLKLWEEEPTLMDQVDQLPSLPAQMFAGERTKGGVGVVISEMVFGALLEISLRPEQGSLLFAMPLSSGTGLYS
jgi:hypothetical protein